MAREYEGSDADLEAVAELSYESAKAMVETVAVAVLKGDADTDPKTLAIVDAMDKMHDNDAEATLILAKALLLVGGQTLAQLATLHKEKDKK